MARFNTRLTLVFALASSLWLQAPQTPANLNQRDIFGRPMGVDPYQDLLESLQGAWQLLEIQDEFLPLSGRSHVGFLTFSERFMSVEIHMRWTEANGDVIEDAFQSGIHEIEFVGPARIRTTTLIGSYLDDNEELEWEVRGFGREFDVLIHGDRLELARDVGSKLVFRRQASRTESQFNIYGVNEGPKGDTDIFGAPIPNAVPVDEPDPVDTDDPEDLGDPEESTGDED